MLLGSKILCRQRETTCVRCCSMTMFVWRFDVPVWRRAPLRCAPSSDLRCCGLACLRRDMLLRVSGRLRCLRPPEHLRAANGSGRRTQGGWNQRAVTGADVQIAHVSVIMMEEGWCFYDSCCPSLSDWLQSRQLTLDMEMRDGGCWW